MLAGTRDDVPYCIVVYYLYKHKDNTNTMNIYKKRNVTHNTGTWELLSRGLESHDVYVRAPVLYLLAVFFSPVTHAWNRLGLRAQLSSISDDSENFPEGRCRRAQAVVSCTGLVGKWRSSAVLYR